MPGYTIDILASSNLNRGHHPRLLGVSAMMRHGSGKSASNTGAEDSTRAADGFWANPATDTGGAGESANTKNDAKDGAGTRLSVSARAAQPPRRGSETRVGFRGVRRRKSGARSDPKTGLGGRSAPTAPSRTQSAQPEFCMNNPCSTVLVQQQRNIRRNRNVCSPRVARFRRICFVVRGFAVCLYGVTPHALHLRQTCAMQKSGIQNPL